jgi:hypothetical protein
MDLHSFPFRELMRMFVLSRSSMNANAGSYLETASSIRRGLSQRDDSSRQLRDALTYLFPRNRPTAQHMNASFNLSIIGTCFWAEETIRTNPVYVQVSKTPPPLPWHIFANPSSASRGRIVKKTRNLGGGGAPKQGDTPTTQLEETILWQAH